MSYTYPDELLERGRPVGDCECKCDCELHTYPGDVRCIWCRNGQHQGDEEIGDEAFYAFEEKLDELTEGLLDAFAAGFGKAVESLDHDADIDTDYRELREIDEIAEAHWYHWDGRTKPLVPWLQKQYGLDVEYEVRREFEGGDCADE